MSRTIIITSDPVARFSSPPADRMAGRPSGVRAARATANQKGLRARAGKPAVSAATEARAQSFLDRESLLDQAVNAGVIGANMRSHYAACYDADPVGTRQYLDDIGLRRAGGAQASEEYVETNLSRAERNRIAGAREGRPSRIINGGL